MRIVTVAGDPEREATLADTLSTRRDVDVVLRCVDRVEVLAAIRTGTLDAVVVVGDPMWFDAECAREGVLHRLAVVALAPDPLAAERMRALGAVTLDYDGSIASLIEACRYPARLPEPPATSDPKGSVVAVWGSKGSPGRSSLVVELSTELARKEPSTLVIDGDTYGGDLLQMFGIIEDVPTIVWAARMATKGELDGDALARSLRRVSSEGPILLAGIARSDLWPDVSERGWGDLLRVVRQTYAFTLCDVAFSVEPETTFYPESGEGRNALARATLRAADHLIGVVRADPVGIKNFLWAREQLREFIDTSGMLLVANRVRPGEEKDVSDVLKRHVGRRPIACIPDEPDLFSLALARGRPVGALKPNSPVARAVAEVAASIGGRPLQRGLLARLSGRR